MRKLDSTVIDVLIVKARPGVHEGRAFRESAMICLEEQINVLLFFNDEQYQFTFNDLLTTYEVISG